MPRVGYHCSHEQHAPSALLGHAVAAERAGFTAAMCSDHLMPWSESIGQGHSGFAWSWLGAALASTQLSFGTVTAPGQRYHPVVLAQAIATLGEMFSGRFWVALGSGEALNEHVTGEPWPTKPERRDRLRECVDVLRALLAGEWVTHDGWVRVREAKIFSRPAVAPPLFGAAISQETARWCGGWADGLITVASEPDTLRGVMTAFRDGGGTGPIYVQVPIATDELVARAWRHAAVGGGEFKADVTLPAYFDAAAKHLPASLLGSAIRISNSAAQHVDWIARDLELGAAGVYVHHVGPTTDHQSTFFETLAPQLLTL